jgi:TonB family protein
MTSPGRKILRACVVQGGKVIEEQRLGDREALTVGTSPKNTFVINDPSLPKSHELFAVRGGVYELVFTEGMRGKISTEASPEPIDLADVKSSGRAEKHGAEYRLKLGEEHRGKVVIGDCTIIFQFVVPPPAPEKPKLPPAVRGSLLKSLDLPYTICLVAATLIEAPLLAVIYNAEPPKEITLETLDERWTQLIVPEFKPAPKKEEKVADKGTTATKEKQKSKAKADDGPVDEAEAAAKKAERRAGIRKEIQGKGILAILGTAGEGSEGGAVADVFGQGGLGGDLDSAFDGIAGVGLASGGSRTTRGGGTGEAASIGGLATAGGGDVGLGGKAERRVGEVKTAAPEVDGALDSESIAKVVKSRMSMVKDCYEKELKRDPGLAGKVEIEFTIDEEGRVTEATVASNSMSSDVVGTCIVGRIKRWRFPKPDGGSVTVMYPFIFTPSS